MGANEHPNRLARETSPYLLQHSRNPVDWYPWGEEALERARREDKPILLSIGYSACHWCHVMARESFEDPETARLMNELFVNVKVDREERPDLDRTYQLAHQLLTRRAGGWPLTVFLTPEDRVPFFAGTYFPREERQGLPAFRDVLRGVDAFFRGHGDELREQNASLLEVLRSIESPAADAAVPDAAPLVTARRQLEAAFDRVNGGFGRAPKFPHPGELRFLLRTWAASVSSGRADDVALKMATLTLRKMALGGIYDQLGGGFCRYSVDERWEIPHFEKMLYDNGLLLGLYAEAWLATGDPLFRRVAEETAGWVMREMQSPQGGYHSSLDADSEGGEGRFYVWGREDVKALLNDEEYRAFARRFGLDSPTNFEGRWHLRITAPMDGVAREFSMPPERLASLVDGARQKLFEARARRAHPGRDEKVLTSWNGLMIRGMACAGRHLGREDLIRSAERALDFIRARLWSDGRLLATFNRGRSRLAAYLDDYAYLLDGVLELLQARWRDGDIAFAAALAEAMRGHFEDRSRGGFYFTADDHERLLYRSKPMADEATPSGNGVAAFTLGRLGHLLGEPRYLESAGRTIGAAWSSIKGAPSAHGALLVALEEHLAPPQLVILRGDVAAMRSWYERCARPYAPGRVTFAIPADARDMPGALSGYRATDGMVAYACTSAACSAPISSVDVLEAELRKTEARAASVPTDAV